MYESFFNLAEKPFTLTPNPRFLFLSHTHNEVYAHLQYGIDNKAGFIEVTGEVGTGKTTILRTLLSRLDEKKYRIAFIFNPKLKANELLRVINREFGLDDSAEGNSDLITLLNDFLLTENQAGRTPVLVIDEAQNLSGEVLEQIRLLSNLETESDKLIQIILVGQPELRQHLNDHSLRQFNQRIAVRYRLLPLDKSETAAYIRNRLRVAGCDEEGMFIPAALEKIYRHSGGVPRRINLICDRALLIAFSQEQRRVNSQHVAQAVREIDGVDDTRLLSSPALSPKLVFCISAVLVVLLVWLLIRFSGGQTTVVASVDDAGAGIKAAPQQIVRADASVAACNELLRLWNSPMLPAQTDIDKIDLQLEFSLRGLNLLRIKGRFSDVSSMNRPLLLPIKREQGGGFMALVSRSEDGLWQVVPDYKGQSKLRSEELNALISGEVFAPWKDFASIGNLLPPGVSGENVRRLQSLLGLTGCSQDLSGVYDAATVACVENFQQHSDLIADGLVGPKTLMMIYRAAGSYPTPTLY